MKDPMPNRKCSSCQFFTADLSQQPMFNLLINLFYFSDEALSIIINFDKYFLTSFNFSCFLLHLNQVIISLTAKNSTEMTNSELQ